MGRSIGAVIVGFLYALATIWLTQMILWFAIPDDPAANAVPEPRLVLTVLCTFAAAVLAGFMTAYVAGRAELAHGLAVGALLVVLLAVTTLVVETEPTPAWYQLALPAVALPGTLLGAGCARGSGAFPLLLRRSPPSETAGTAGGGRYPIVMHTPANLTGSRLRAGMVGLGMIFDDTYRPLFEQLHAEGLFRRDFGLVDVELSAVASRTGSRAERYRHSAAGRLGDFASFTGDGAIRQLLGHGVDVVCIATPDDRHFEGARAALAAGKHVLIEKPSVLRLQELDELDELARKNDVLAKVVYHKLADPDHKKLRTHVIDGVLKHVNNGYCSLLEPKQVSGSQFAEWIGGRNPGTYVAVHYVKLIDFTFGPAWRLARVTATGQRGLVGPADGSTWDSVQLQIVYLYPDGREAAFDVHTSWVTPDNFPGYVEQEVQFRFDNGVWNAHQRKRGVEVTVEGRTPADLKITPNHHYNGTFVEPWGARSQRGYGVEVLRRFFEEAAYVEHGGPPALRAERLKDMRALAYNNVSADRNTVAVVQALEAILTEHARGVPGCAVTVNGPEEGLVLWRPGRVEPTILYPGRV